MTDSPRTVEQLDRGDGNSLQANYEHHDVAEQHFLDRLPADVTVFSLGIDQRDDDSGTLTYDDNPDFLIEGDDGCGALVDVKSKTSAEWIRLINERHYWKYRGKADEYGVPAFVYFYNTSTASTLVCRVDGSGDVYCTSTHDFMLTFPDHNDAAYLTDETDVSWDTFIEMYMRD